VGVYLKRSLVLMALVPIGVVTLTSTVPSGSAGDTAVIEVEEFTVELTAAADPKFTAVAPLKLAPAILTVVPSTVEPWLGDTFLTSGGET